MPKASKPAFCDADALRAVKPERVSPPISFPHHQQLLRSILQRLKAGELDAHRTSARR